MYKPEQMHKAEDLLKDSKNTRKVLADEIEELYGIINHVSKQKYSVERDLQAAKNSIEWHKDEIKRIEREKHVLEKTIVGHAMKAVGCSV